MNLRFPVSVLHTSHYI